MDKKNIMYFLLGICIVFSYASFTRDWNEALPTDSTVANQIDDYNRYLRVDASDRLKDMFYGFIAGENTLSQHAQYIQFYEQASVSQPSAAYGRIYGKAVDGKCELHWDDEDGDELQLTTGGNTGGGHVQLLAGMDLLGSSTSDITINTDKFTVAGATGNTVIAGTCDITGVATLGDASLLKTSAAPSTDAMIANKKYVDDQITAALPDDDAFGSWASKSVDTVYQAASDGFVLVTSTGADQRPRYTVYTDSSNPPTTNRARERDTDGGTVGSVCVPVKKNDYWKVTDDGGFGNITIYWLPIGG